MEDSTVTDWGVVETLKELVLQASLEDRIFVDIPIGLPESGDSRPCDKEARKVLGKPRSNSVFPALPRVVLGTKTYDGKPMEHAKKEPEGRRERLRVLVRHNASARQTFNEALRGSPRKELQVDDVLDALAIAVTGSSDLGAIRTLPANPHPRQGGPADGDGLLPVRHLGPTPPAATNQSRRGAASGIAGKGPGEATIDAWSERRCPGRWRAAGLRGLGSWSKAKSNQERSTGARCQHVHQRSRAYVAQGPSNSGTTSTVGVLAWCCRRSSSRRSRRAATGSPEGQPQRLHHLGALPQPAATNTTVIFVSADKTDFCGRRVQDRLHPELRREANEVEGGTLTFFTDVASLLKDIEEPLPQAANEPAGRVRLRESG